MLHVLKHSCRLLRCTLLVGLGVWAHTAYGQAFAPGLQRSAPWPRRERQGVVIEPSTLPLRSHGSMTAPRYTLALQEARRLGIRPLPLRSSPLRAWPPEPPSPPSVDVARFASALSELCAIPDASELAQAIVGAAAQFEIDPFLLAGVAHQQSRCRAERADAYGIGLTRINVGMFSRGMRAGAYHYGAPDGDGGFETMSLLLPRYPFSAAALRDPVANAYFAAALMSVFEKQCPEVDAYFGSVPHRHHVSHFAFGDRVRSSLPEDEILIARRRLLYHYAPYCEPPSGQVADIALSSPLAAPPRLLIGVIGEPRDNGKRIHLGIDLHASEGEAVRVMAPGVVTFAGVDHRDRGLVQMSSVEAERVLPAALGARGLFVRVSHGAGVETLYVHLASYSVRTGQRLERSEQLGVVGRTGVHASDAHLHLGMFLDGLPIDPLPPLAAYVVPVTGESSRLRSARAIPEQQRRTER
jgi:hypothetical protein